MKHAGILLGASIALSVVSSVHAIDEGVAKGTLNAAGTAVALAHSYAWRHENEEGLLDGPELRILLADRKVDHTLLSGIYTARLDELARTGGVRGVMITVDPRKPTAGMRGVLLMPESNPAKMLTTFSMSGGDGGFGKLDIQNLRVLGDARYDSTRTSPAIAYSATFSAPLFREEPVTASHSGAKAMESAPFKAFAAYRKALGAGDLDGARRLATAETFREVDALIAQAGKPAAMKMLREMAMLPGAKNRPQVFVRGARALVVYREGDGRAMQSLVLKDGAWLVD